MNFIIWIIVGGIIGWLASLIMKTDAQQGVLLNVVVGIIGAVLGGWLISPLVGFYKPERSAADGGTQLGGRDSGSYMQLIVGTFF